MFLSSSFIELVVRLCNIACNEPRLGLYFVFD